MATTPSTSISSSYQRLGGSTPVITQAGGSGGPNLVKKKTLEEKMFEEYEAEKKLAQQKSRDMEEGLKKYRPDLYNQLQTKRAYDKDVARIQQGKAPSEIAQPYFKNEMRGLQKLPWK